MYQQIILIGNVGRDPEMSYTPQGIAVCKFSIAVNKVHGKGDARKEKITWFRVTVWRDRAETASQYIRKGMWIMIIGEIGVSVYTDKQGQPAATLEVTANYFKFLDRAEKHEQAPVESGSTEPSDAPADNGSEDVPF